jgi:integrase
MKFGIREYKPGHFQVTFSFEGRQVHLQRNPWGQPLNSDIRAGILVAWLKKNGYNPEQFGKDTSFQFDRAIQTWLKSSTASPEWVQRLREIARKFFIPHFKKMDIRNIKTAHIQALYATLLDKYSPKYCKNVMGELHAFLNFYKKSLPTFPDFPRIPLQEKPIRWLTEKEQDQLFKYIPEVDKPIFELLRHYGCRCNEAGGLLKKNVFLNHTPPYFTIATTLRENGQLREFTKTKTIRVLPIVAETRWIFENRGDGDFVFTTKKGRLYTNQRLTAVWKKANKLSGVEKINLYNGTRHSFGCQRLNAGYTIEEVRIVLGHSTSKMTQRYAQYTLQSLENIVRGNIYTPIHRL